jgi:hypothetical protein
MGHPDLFESLQDQVDFPTVDSKLAFASGENSWNLFSFSQGLTLHTEQFSTDFAMAHFLTSQVLQYPISLSPEDRHPSQLISSALKFKPYFSDRNAAVFTRAISSSFWVARYVGHSEHTRPQYAIIGFILFSFLCFVECF